MYPKSPKNGLKQGYRVIWLASCKSWYEPIENLWGIIARVVYGNGAQFFNVADSKQKVLQS